MRPELMPIRTSGGLLVFTIPLHFTLLLAPLPQCLVLLLLPRHCNIQQFHLPNPLLRKRDKAQFKQWSWKLKKLRQVHTKGKGKEKEKKTIEQFYQLGTQENFVTGQTQQLFFLFLLLFSPSLFVKRISSMNEQIKNFYDNPVLLMHLLFASQAIAYRLFFSFFFKTAYSSHAARGTEYN